VVSQHVRGVRTGCALAAATAVVRCGDFPGGERITAGHSATWCDVTCDQRLAQEDGARGEWTALGVGAGPAVALPRGAA